MKNKEIISINITEAKARFYEIVDRAIQGEIFLITRYGKPVVYMKPYRPNAAKLEKYEQN